MAERTVISSETRRGLLWKLQGGSVFYKTLLSLIIIMTAGSIAQSSPNHAPLRVGIVGLVHGHVHGFLDQSQHSAEIEIVGVAESDRKLLDAAGTRYGFDRTILFTDLDEMLTKTHPQAVLVYTNTYDHRRVVEICARHSVHVMMEKPLAVSFDDALAMEKAAHAGKIHVLVNYERPASATGSSSHKCWKKKDSG